MITWQITKVIFVRCDTEGCNARSGIFETRDELDVWITGNYWLEVKANGLGTFGHLCVPCSQDMQKRDMERQLGGYSPLKGK